MRSRRTSWREGCHPSRLGTPLRFAPRLIQRRPSRSSTPPARPAAPSRWSSATRTSTRAHSPAPRTSASRTTTAGSAACRSSTSAGSRAADGWLHTGDRGLSDAEGNLAVEGRIADTIVTGGENVSAAEVEEALLTPPAVEDVAVVGRPDPEWGQAVTAYVVGEVDA